MTGMMSAFIAACIAFIATNLDDILILTALFASTPSSIGRVRVVVGQYVGIIILTFSGLVGSLGTLIISKQWIGLLGVIPVYMGVKMIYSGGDTDAQHSRDIKEILLNSNTYKVVAITVSNGSDNLSVYIPMFMRYGAIYKAVIVAVFMILTGIWCLVAYKIVMNPLMDKWIRRYSRAVVPVVLIGLGGYILFENKSFSLFSKLF